MEKQLFVVRWLHAAARKTLPYDRWGMHLLQLVQATPSISVFANDNPDCDYNSILKEILSLLEEIAEADGKLDEREEMAIQKVGEAFQAQKSLLGNLSSKLWARK